jgi:hypothetical protein
MSRVTGIRCVSMDIHAVYRSADRIFLVIMAKPGTMATTDPVGHSMPPRLRTKPSSAEDHKEPALEAPA